MTLIHRVARLFTADLHAVLDRLEEPEALLKQAIRDMEELIVENEQRVLLLEHEEAELGRRSAAIAEALAGIDRELDLCLSRSEDVLARSLVRRKLEAERSVRALCTRREDVARSLIDARALLDEERRELDSVRQKAELVVPVREGAAPFGMDQPISNEDVEIALLRERERRQPS
jgi:phage shock protein A